MEAVARKPGARDYLERLWAIQLKNRNPEGAVATLRAALKGSHTSRARADLQRRELFTSLYVRPPIGFNRALEVARELRDNGEAERDEFVPLWTAAAYGQKFAWLSQNNGSSEEMSAVRASALEAVEQVVKLQPSREAPSRKLLQQMYDPTRFSGNAEDNDLEVFKGDPAFEHLIVGS